MNSASDWLVRCACPAEASVGVVKIGLPVWSLGLGVRLSRCIAYARRSISLGLSFLIHKLKADRASLEEKGYVSEGLALFPTQLGPQPLLASGFVSYWPSGGANKGCCPPRV